MKKLSLLLAIIIASCSSIKQHNEHINDLIPAEKLKQDVDFAYNRLQKMHPKLYWYISKKDLDYKFDSLKTTIQNPMTTIEFYKKLAPVVSAIKEGHIVVYPSVKQLTKTENKILKSKGLSPLSQFEFEVFDNKLFVVKNKSKDKSIKIGSEVASINGSKTEEMLKEYSNYFSSDGYNKTYKKRGLARRFSTFYTYFNGIKDSLKYELKLNDSIKTVVIKRERKAKNILESRKPTIYTQREKDSIVLKNKQLKIDKKVRGYDPDNKNYSRNLSFKLADSSVAVMKINRFRIGNYKKFYKESFEKIKQKNCKSLILDLRNNGGGRLNEINDLYSYLADSTFVFLEKSEVTSRNSLFKYYYLQGGSPFLKTAKIIGTPLVYPFFYFSIDIFPNKSLVFQ